MLKSTSLVKFKQNFSTVFFLGLLHDQVNPYYHLHNTLAGNIAPSWDNQLILDSRDDYTLPALNVDHSSRHSKTSPDQENSFPPSEPTGMLYQSRYPEKEFGPCKTLLLDKNLHQLLLLRSHSLRLMQKSLSVFTFSLQKSWDLPSPKRNNNFFKLPF